MGSRFQAAALVASPSYPNSVAWSDENLVAVASGHLVTILNPAMPFGPRGLITIPANKPFPIGMVERKDLLSDCLLPTILSRDIRPCVRSISWSPVGLAPNAGCLLAVCTTDGRVKLYRFPFCEFSAEWVEVMDISEILYTYLAKMSFGELDVPSSEFSNGKASQLGTEHGSDDDLSLSVLRDESKRRKQNAVSIINNDAGTLGDQSLYCGNSEDANPSSSPFIQKSITAFTEVAVFPCSLLQEGSSVEILTLDGNQRNWVAGILEQLSGAKALVLLPEKDGNGKRDKWVEIDQQDDNVIGSNLLSETMIGQSHFPKIRPSMNVGHFPEQILLGNCHGVEDILKIGQAVEALTNHGWFEGVFMGLNESSLQVKLYGDNRVVTLDTGSVRLAPIWTNEQKSWQATVVKVEINQDLQKAVEIESDSLEENIPLQIISAPNSKAKSPTKGLKKCSLPLITSDQYASRSAMLSSLVVAWSPMLRITSEFGLVSPNNSSTCCSILAVGGKSGRISFWRIYEPQCYSIMHGRDPTAALLIGLLRAHNTWITAVGWALLVSDASNPQLLLATGSSDGSVKIWQGYSAELLKSSEVSHASFSLLKEVKTIDAVPVSVLSLIVPVKSPHKMFLAVGKGSGSLEVWICDMPTCKFDKAGSYDLHDHIVTGLAWAFDGSCLYSCSQDNSVHSWILHEDSFCEVPIPSNTPGVKSSTDVPNVFDSCFGLAVSPGNLVVAVARSFDADLLNPMYQARTQKAAVEFFWIGGQKPDNLLNRYPDFDVEAFPGFPNEELVYWEHNILWSLNQYEHPDKPLVVWDTVAALLAFRQSAPKYVEHILLKWLISYVESDLGIFPAKILSHASRLLSNITSRQLHLLNIISRHVVLAEPKADKINSEKQKLEGLCGVEEEQLTLWMELLESSEKELRERLVSFSFSTIINLMSHSSPVFCKPGYWQPFGLAQMERWVATNSDNVKDYLKLLASEVGKLDKRHHSIREYVAEDECSYCSASVPFESTEAAFCEGVNYDDGVGQSHKLARCAVSMQVCPTTPSWFCVCCHRWASKLAPQTLFTMPRYPTDFYSNTKTSTLKVFLKPFCPFCGILLQRLQPEFLLSASSV